MTDRACAAYAAHVGEDGMRAAISAYFADVPVSEEALQVGGIEVHGHKKMSTLESAHLARGFKTICAKHAEELSNGRWNRQPPMDWRNT